jgi:ParB-like nuclease domain
VPLSIDLALFEMEEAKCGCANPTTMPQLINGRAMGGGVHRPIPRGREKRWKVAVENEWRNAMAGSESKPTEWFKPSRNVRSGPLDEMKLRELGSSMLRFGQLQDVIAESDGTLIAGYRRLAAAKLVGIETLTVKIVES